MNNIPYIHNPKDKRNLIKSYYIALMPLLIFGFYKNGILLYNNNLISFKNALIPLYFYLISVLVGFIVSKIIKKNTAENILAGLICSASISINTNIIIYPILLFVLLFIVNYIDSKYKLKFNFTALIRIFLILGLLLNAYSYLNIGEKLNKFNYNYFDILCGYQVGGIATSSTILVIISLIILAFNKFYKKEVAFSACLSFIIMEALLFLISKNYSILINILNGTIYFSFIFVAADLVTTPYAKKGMLIYGILIGFIASILSLIINIYEIGYISIFMVSLIIPLINRFINKKHIKDL